MLARSPLVLGLCGLVLAAPALPAVAAPDDVQQPAAAPAPYPTPGSQPPIVLDQGAGAQPWSTYEPTPAAQPPVGSPMPSSAFQPLAGSRPSAAYPPPFAPPGMSGSRPGSAPIADASKPASAPHRHKGLFGWRHCVECQRAHVKQHDGVEVPPPPGPPMMAGMATQGEMIVNGPMVITDSHGTVIKDSQEAGFAVVGPGGDVSAPGVAVVGGSGPAGEPTPIGVARGGQNPWADPRMAAMAPVPAPARMTPRSSRPASPRRRRP